MEPRTPRPPAAAVRLLRRRLDPEIQDFLLGDLEERFTELARTRYGDMMRDEQCEKQNSKPVEFVFSGHCMPPLARIALTPIAPDRNRTLI